MNKKVLILFSPLIALILVRLLLYVYYTWPVQKVENFDRSKTVENTTAPSATNPISSPILTPPQIAKTTLEKKELPSEYYTLLSAAQRNDQLKTMKLRSYRYCPSGYYDYFIDNRVQKSWGEYFGDGSEMDGTGDEFIENNIDVLRYFIEQVESIKTYYEEDWALEMYDVEVMTSTYKDKRIWGGEGQLIAFEMTLKPNINTAVEGSYYATDSTQKFWIDKNTGLIVKDEWEGLLPRTTELIEVNQKYDPAMFEQKTMFPRSSHCEP